MLKTLCVSLAALAALGALGQAAPAVAQAKAPYVIYLSNNFVGNDWRQQMQRVAQVSVDKGPLKGTRRPARSRSPRTRSRRRSTRSTTSSAQKPDAILVDAGSDTALNPTIKRPATPGSSSSASTRW